MDYNTTREQLKIREYGRSIQDMVEYCKSLEDKKQRQICANTIVMVMARKEEISLKVQENKEELWNHLAEIAGYDLDIDYPVEIIRKEADDKPSKIAYPQTRIGRRHYGLLVEKFTKVLMETEDDKKKDQLTLLVANHMKRDLSNWSVDSMSDEKVASDLAYYTEGKVNIDVKKQPLTTDGELLSSLVSTSLKKRRKK